MRFLAFALALLLLFPGPARGQQLGGKYTEGVSFTATDSLRSWSLDITFLDRLTLRAPVFGDSAYDATIDAPQRAADRSNLRYHATTSRGEVIVTVEGSDDKDLHSVQIDVMPADGSVMTLHRGTGRYLPPQELHYAWRLVSFNGEAIDPKRFREAPPGLAFQVPLGTVTGTTGCNDISGDFSTGYRVLRFGRLVGTRMACPPVAELEQRYMQALSGRELRYSVTSAELRLHHGDGTELLFRRVR
jgi:heat shock protein HslJ